MAPKTEELRREEQNRDSSETFAKVNTTIRLCPYNSVWPECLFYMQEVGGSNPSGGTKVIL